MTDQDIEAVAMAMCAELGIDPMQEVWAEPEAIRTPSEIVSLEREIVAWRKKPRTGANTDLYGPRGEAGWHPRWKVYRGRAAEAIAAHRAVAALSR